MASRLEILSKFIGGSQKATIGEEITWRAVEGRLDDAEGVMQKPYRKSDLVYICISTTARAIGQIPIKVYRQVNDEEYHPLPLSDPWNRLFAYPNYLMDRYSFVEAIVGHLMLDGNVFIIPFPPGATIPSSLWVVPLRCCAPIRAKSGDKPTGQLIGWCYNPHGVQVDSYRNAIIGPDSIMLSVDEVCHIFFWNPDDPIIGLAPHEAGKMNIVVDYKAARFTSNFFDEGAVPGGILYTDKTLSDKQFKRILDQFESQHGTYRRSHRVALLENGLKYTQAGITQKDMEFPKLREMSANRIFQIYGMKKAIISETQDINYATSREQRREWWESTNLPIMRMITSALNFTLFGEDISLQCAFDTTKIEALRDALRDKADTAYRLWQMGAPFNEVNERLGLGFKRQPWGDVWYMPVNLIPVSTPSSASSPEEEQEQYQSRVKQANLLQLEDFSKDERVNAKLEAVWNKFVSLLVPLEESFAKKVSRIFYDMRKKALSLLYQRSSGKIVDKTVEDVDKETFSEEGKTLSKVTQGLYIQALELGVEMVISETGASIAFNISDPEAVQFLTAKKLEIVRIIDTVKEQIRTQLLESLREGESVEQAANRIRSVFDIAKTRAKVIARTEMGGACNEGRWLAINRSGFKEKEWFTAMDERVRPQHRPMNGKRIRVGEYWVLPDGSRLRHPGDFQGPAHQVINCRCIEVVVPESLELSLSSSYTLNKLSGLTSKVNGLVGLGRRGHKL